MENLEFESEVGLEDEGLLADNRIASNGDTSNNYLRNIFFGGSAIFSGLGSILFLSQGALGEGFALSAFSGANALAAHNARNQHKSQNEEVQNDIGDAYFFDGEVDLSEFLEKSSVEEVEDLYFDTGESHRLSEFYEDGDINEALSLYDDLEREVGDRHQFLSVKHQSGRTDYLLEVAIDGEIGGRFAGYTEERPSDLLMEGEDPEPVIAENYRS